jgi:hypothetical protein
LWRNTGVAFGLVAAPASLGLYGLYFIGPIAALLGMLGLVLTLFHGSPGYNLAVALGLMPSHTVTSGAGSAGGCTKCRDLGFRLWGNWIVL